MIKVVRMFFEFFVCEKNFVPTDRILIRKQDKGVLIN